MWEKFINEEKNKDYFKKLWAVVGEDYNTKKVYPPKDELFTAFELTPYQNVKVVWLGQDPYHNPNEANGLAFSVKKGVKVPPSLRNMFKELHSDLGLDIPNSGDLSPWAKEGIFLLNTCLSVVENKPLSHSKIGWEIFTDNVIKFLNERNEKIVFVLLGNNAKAKKKLITNPTHVVIEGVHPSPLSASRGFLGSKIYTSINNAIDKPIKWDLV